MFDNLPLSCIMVAVGWLCQNGWKIFMNRLKSGTA